MNENKVDEKSFAEQVKKALKSQKFKIPVQQIITNRRPNGEIISSGKRKSITNRLFKKRIFYEIDKPGLPYGYKSISIVQAEVDNFVDKYGEGVSHSKKRKLS